MGAMKQQRIEKSSAKTGSTKTSKTYDVVFVPCELDSDQTQALKAMVFTDENAMQAIDKWAEEYVISFKWDTFSKACACFMRPIDTGHENHGYILTGRGSSFLKAIKQVMYKHEVLIGDKGWASLDRNRAFVIDD